MYTAEDISLKYLFASLALLMSVLVLIQDFNPDHTYLLKSGGLPSK